MGKYNGFSSYLETGEITPEFIGDFQYWCRKIFNRWTLFTPFEDFYSQCWEALMERLPKFDPKIATIQTLCISTANNECWRIYMKNKIKLSHPEDDIDDPVVNSNIKHEVSWDVCLALQDDFNNLGIEIDLETIRKEYNNDSFFGKCLMWRKMKDERKFANRC